MDLFLIDAIGPFFRDHPLSRINWSKVPFDHLKLEGEERREQFDRIRADMHKFGERISRIGYNAVSLDDLAHLSDHELYEPEVRRKNAVLREEFRELFRILRGYGLRLFITTDVVSYTPALKKALGSDTDNAISFLKSQIEEFLTEFPEVEGLILRIGESDGLDVRGDFRSELVLRHARHVRRMLNELLPVFERHERKLIFRTWTVGAYSIGDLMWHRRTLARSLKGVESPALILSMKYGESDFFRYLPLNRNFFGTPLPKIIELQTRREYEGCGEYPSFVGIDYEHYASELEEAENVVGISVWCQTGGWLPFRRLAFLDDNAIWTEINTEVTLRIFRYGELVEHAVRLSAEERGLADWEAALELLRLSDEAVKQLLYIAEFAKENLYFRRVRIPPLLHVYWNTIFINHSVRVALKNFVRDPGLAMREAHQALHKIERMRDLAGQAGLPADDIDFMYETFNILALAREYYLGSGDDRIRKRIKKAKKRYKKRFPKQERYRYRVRVNYEPFRVSARFFRWVVRLMARSRPGYRIIDRLLTLHLLGFVYLFVRKRRPNWIPEFARKSAMGIDAVFR